MNTTLKIITLLLWPLILSSQLTYLHCGRILDMTSDKLQSEKTIVVTDGIITAIEDGYVMPEGEAKIVDLKDLVVMPGFMDMHVHIEHENNPNRYMNKVQHNPEDIALNSVKFCRRTLMAGFTTVRDLGGIGVNVAIRDAVNDGDIIGPRIYTSEKTISTTGGHQDPTNSWKRSLQGDPDPKDGIINSATEANKAVRQRYKNGADCIKITATGGVLSQAKDGLGPHFTIDEIKAVVDVAKDYGFVTAAHAHGTEGMKRAVMGGIHSIEHGTYMSEEVMAMMIDSGTYYVPTISAGKFVAAKAEQPGYFPSIIVPKARKIGPQIQETFAKAYKRGVKIAFGTDAGVSPHGDNGLEFVYMVESGMSPWDALLSATVNAADLMQVSDQLGTLEKGKKADIIALKGNPLENINHTLDVPFVMKEGDVYKKP